MKRRQQGRLAGLRQDGAGMGVFLAWLSRGSVSDAEVRAEIWRLGSRHLGEPLEGARKELQAEDVTPERATLLRACIRQLRRR